MYAYNYYQDELYHWGIKGMKWGVRRFQKKDGTLTSAGKKRYSEDVDSDSKPTSKSKSSKVKVTHRDVLEKKYRDKGMSAEEAKAAAEKRLKVERVIAGTAALTVAACVAYYAKNKYSETYCDQVLKAGTTFHNLDAKANPRPGEHLYVNYRQNDVNYFRGHFAVNKMRRAGTVFDHTITTTDDIKIPSVKTRKSVFKHLYENDQDFKEAFNRHVYGESASTVNLPNFTYRAMWQKFGDKDTPDFNVAKRKYFDALSQKGYSAIVDEWDTSKGVFRSDAPLILLNTSDKKFGEMSIKELTARDIVLSQTNARHYEGSRNLLNFLGTPHTNHFQESKGHKARYAAKSIKNSENINRIISKMTDEEVKNYALKEKGHVLADAGKYMAKNNKLSAEQAIAKAKAKQDKIKNAAVNTALVSMYAPAVLYREGQSVKYARDYLSKNPDTKLTYKQIKKMSRYNEKVRKYMEEHPDTELTPMEIMRL